MPRMTEKPIVTVRVMIYNNASKLHETIDSIIMQDYDAIEVIISDDGSTDPDRELLEKERQRAAEKCLDALLLPAHENMGTVAHLNLINKKANGRYLMSCCPGDVLNDAHTVSSIVEAFEKTGCRYLTSRRLDVYDDHTKVRPYAFTGLLLSCMPGRLMNHMIKNRNLISGCSSFERKDIFETYGPYDEDYRLLEDFPFVIKLLQKKEKIGFLNKVTVRHGMGSGVSTGEIHPAIYKDLMTMRKKLLADPEGLYQSTVDFLKMNIEE